MPVTETIAQLMVKLGLDTKDVERDSKKAQGAFDELGRSLAGALSIGALIQFGTKAVEAFGDSERAIAKVENALSSMGRVGFYSLDELTSKARDLQRTSIFDDDTILESVTQRLVTFGNIGRDSFDRAQQAAVDLAAALGMDLKSAAEIVGRALESPVDGTRQLRSANIVLTEAQRETIRSLQETGDVAGAQAIVFELLEQKVGGAAAAVAAAGTGPMVQLQNALGDVMEVAGAAIAEVLVPMAEAARGLAYAFTNMDPDLQKVIVSFGLLAAAISAVWLATGPIGAAIAGISIALAALYANWDTVVAFLQSSWLTFKAVFLEGVSIILGSLEGFINSALNVIRPLASWIGVDVPANVSLGSKALHDAATQAVLDLGELESKQRAAAAEAATMKANAAAAAAALAGQSASLAASASTAAGAVGGLGSALDAVNPSSIVTGLQSVELQGLAPLRSSALQVPTTLEEVTTQLETQTLPGMEQTFKASTSRMSGYLSDIGSALRDDIAGIMTSSIGPALDSIIPGFGKIRGFFDELPALSMAINNAISDLMGDLLSYLVQVAGKMLGIQAAAEGVGGVTGSVAGSTASAAGSLSAIAVALGSIALGVGLVLGLGSLLGGIATGPGRTYGEWVSDANNTGAPGEYFDPATQQWVDQYAGMFDPETGVFLGGQHYVSTGGAQGRMGQTINVILDGQTIATAVVQNMPEVLDIYGIG